MANFPQYNYQPPMNGFAQQMLPAMYQQPAYQAMQPTMQQEQNLFCRMATNREEVQAFPVDFTGKPMTFIGPQAQTVWIKTFNPATGGSDVREYREAKQTEEQPKYVTTADLEQVLQVIKTHGEEIAQLRGQTRRRAMKEDETSEV